MNTGLIGAIIGPIIGVLGGLIGTCVSIKNTNGPRERAFMVRLAVGGWIGFAVFIAGMLVLPQLRLWLWIPYSLLLLLGIRYGNKKQAAIRQEEQANA